MNRLIAAAALVLAVAGCSGTAEEPTSAPKATIAPKPTQTTVSERLQHWREVVQPMRCGELNELEGKRMAIAFNDQTESLVAIHERQAELHC